MNRGPLVRRPTLAGGRAVCRDNERYVPRNTVPMEPTQARIDALAYAQACVQVNADAAAMAGSNQDAADLNGHAIELMLMHSALLMARATFLAGSAL